MGFKSGAGLRGLGFGVWHCLEIWKIVVIFFNVLVDLV